MAYARTHNRTDAQSGTRYTIRTAQCEGGYESVVCDQYGTVLCHALRSTALKAARQALRHARRIKFYRYVGDTPTKLHSSSAQ